MGLLVFAGIPLALLILAMPVFLVLIIAAASGILYQGVPVQALHTAIFGSLANFTLLAVPLFILAGEVMARGGIARRLIEFLLSVVGGVRGSLAIATIGSAAAFGAMSGSSVAAVAAIGKLTLPALEKNGYGRNFSVSLIAATGVIDVIIPPSIPMIIYGIAAQVSITTLFLAGIVPGLIIALALSVYVMVRARVEMIPIGDPVRWRNIAEAGRNAVWAALAPVVILGGIYGGIFTPTEAGGVGCVYAILVSVYAHRELTWREIWQITMSSSLLIGQIMIIVAAAGAYAWLITTSGAAQALVSTIADLNLGAPALLLIVNFVLLFVGTVLEPPAAILVLMPLLLPMVQEVGVDPIHFGMVVTVNLAIGLFMPPFGLNLFAAHSIFGVPMGRLYKGVLPFVAIYLMVLMLITYLPIIVMGPLQLLK